MYCSCLCECCGRQSTLGPVWLHLIAVVAPDGQAPSRIVGHVEDLLVQQFIPEPTIEGLDEGVPGRLAQPDVVRPHIGPTLPFQHNPADPVLSL